jgi:RimJ/RimL family protein N-acetyltransferase
VLKPDYPLRTERLILRPFTPSDLRQLHSFHSLPEVTRFLYWQPRDLAQVREVLDDKIARSTLHEEGQALALAVELAATGALVGDCSLFWLSRQHRQGEIGFVFHPAHHGQGLATEAARELLRLGFDQLGLHRMIGRCDARNTGSARVMERLGMRREAHLVENERFKGEWADELIYAMLNREWRDTPAR